MLHLNGRPLWPVLFGLAWLALPAPAELPARFQVWRRSPDAAGAVSGPGDAPMAVGSLQKPFVVQAWAAGHPGQPAPRLRCPPGPGCWNHSGHGELGLVQALALSCNAYFRGLAADTAPALLTAAFAEAGFLGAPRSPDAAIGLINSDAIPVIRPSALLQAYAALVHAPWRDGEALRTQVLAGLREAARVGTAGGLAGRGCWAKTGTIPLDALHTAGLALVVDDAGWATLGRLEPGTGRAAALRLGQEARPSIGAGDPGAAGVTVRLLDLLAGRRVWVRNPGSAPVPAASGFLGPGAQFELAPGQWVGPGLLEVREPKSGLVRQLRGRIECRAVPGGGHRLILACALQDYVQGVLAAELSNPADPRRLDLGATVLRFVARGPRHPDADLCDSTHCAWFVGMGQAPRWPASDTFSQAREELMGTAIGPAAWAEMVERSRRPGPSQWTSHCGGRPLSPRTLWGGEDGAAPPCPRHHGGDRRPWRRSWGRSSVEKAFGGPVEHLQVGEAQGKWVLQVEGPRGRQALDYDSAHRRLAVVLGWGALPSPADSVEAGPEGFIVRGVGLGHRVGLCLGD